MLTLFQLSNIPRIEPRLQAMVFKKRFFEEAKEIKPVSHYIFRFKIICLHRTIICNDRFVFLFTIALAARIADRCLKFGLTLTDWERSHVGASYFYRSMSALLESSLSLFIAITLLWALYFLVVFWYTFVVMW